MSCLSANAKLVTDKVDVGASLQENDASAQAVLIKDDLEARAEIKRDKIDIDVAIICAIGKDNSLWASDGVLYDKNSDPLFVTE